MKRKILFITGTRADFGKLKPLIRVVNSSPEFQSYIFVTGMHTLSRYGLTQNEVKKEGFKNIFVFMNQFDGEPMELSLANTIIGLSRYVREYQPDLIIVHGDRVEALAGAIVGVIKNILVAHIEGGERSGTVDDIIRHSVTKLSHVHFVANEEAKERLRQMGENPQQIYVIGSPDIDIMLSPDLPKLGRVKARYGITFNKYSIMIFHPVISELDSLDFQVRELVSSIIESKLNYIVIYPNNDEGCSEIFKAYKRLENNPNIILLPSIRFEYFLTLLRNAVFIIGNSSAGIREAPVYGVYSINVGSRQKNRFRCKSIIDVNYQKSQIISAINNAINSPELFDSITYFGDGQSAENFINVLENGDFWKVLKQKEFIDVLPTLKKLSNTCDTQ